MEEEKKQGLSRRAFLGLGGTALAGAAVAGLAGCAPQSGGDAAKATTEGASGGTTGGMPVAESGASAEMCIRDRFDPIKEMMPNYEPPASSADGGKIDLEEYPIILTTGRRIPVYFHSEHRQLPWCRELWPAPRLEMNPADAAELGLEQGDWAWIETEWGKVRQSVDLYHGIAKGWANAEHAW